jgi:hypothetical protein
VLNRMASYLYNLLFDAGDLTPLPKRRAAVKVVVTPAEKKLRQRRLSRWRRRQQILFDYGPPPEPAKKPKRRRGRRRKRKIPWYDLPAERVEQLAKRSRTLRRDIAAYHAQVAEGCQQVQSGWTNKHERKANHYPIQPVVLEPQSVDYSDDHREVFE